MKKIELARYEAFDMAAKQVDKEVEAFARLMSGAESEDRKIVLWSLWMYQGKLYRVAGFSRGAGSLKEQDLIHYEPCYDCDYSEFTRPMDEFKTKFVAYVEVA